MKQYKQTILILAGFLLAGCGSTSQVGGSGSVKVDKDQVQIKMIHYNALYQQLSQNFGLTDDSEAISLLEANQALFQDVTNYSLTKRAITQKIFIRACKEANHEELFTNPTQPTLQGMWGILYPNEEVPEGLKSGETAIQALNIENDGLMATSLCVLGATSLYNTAVNVSRL